MDNIELKREHIEKYHSYLLEEEKSQATIEKYVRDVEVFYQYARGQELNKNLVIAYKERIREAYAVSSVNSILSSINSLLMWMGRYDCRVRRVKMQRQIFCREEKELNRREYTRLLNAAKSRNERLYLLLETICSTGIRISELQYITTEAVRKGRAQVNCKGKVRIIFIPEQIGQKLQAYARKKKISKGGIFITKSGRPMDRSNIWKEMKSLCKKAKVDAEKVFPHNLRHLFARTFYAMKKDIAGLADILGHGSIETTRIYTISSGKEHARQVQKLGLVM